MTTFDHYPYMRHSTASSCVPAHKQTDPTKAPGQIVNKFDTTLSDYITSIKRRDALDQVAQEKKLSFDEWYVSLKAKPGQMPYDDWFIGMQAAWQAGQENK